MPETTNTPTTPDELSVTLTESERYRMLASERRRIVLDVLSDTARPMNLTELTDAVVDREFDLLERNPTVRERVKLSLYHNHLPLLDGLDVIVFDPDEKLVTPNGCQ